MTPKQKRAAYFKKYREEHADYDRQRKREWYLQNRDSIIGRSKENLSKKRQPLGPKYKVGQKRLYLYAGGRIYFNSRLGYTPQEIEQILKEVSACRKQS